MSADQMPATLKSRLAAGNKLRGMLVRVPAPMLIDMAGTNGYDFIFLDTEHGIADQKDIADHITAAKATHSGTYRGGGSRAGAESARRRSRRRHRSPCPDSS